MKRLAYLLAASLLIGCGGGGGGGGDSSSTDISVGGWTLRKSGTAVALRGAAFGNGAFVVVGDNGTMLLSNNNGFSWEIKATGTTEPLRSVCYADGIFVAVGEDGITLISNDNGSTWYKGERAPDGFYSIAYGNKTLVGVGPNTNIFTSTDNGSSWTIRNAELYGIQHPPLWSVAFGDGKFIAVGQAISQLSTDNGISWQLTSAVQSEIAANVIIKDNIAYIVEPSGVVVTVAFGYYSSYIPVLNFTHPYSIGYGNNIFMFVGSSGKVVTFNDIRSTWKETPIPTNYILWSIAYGNGVFISVGENGTIIQSDVGWN